MPVWSKDNPGDLQRLLAYALPDVDPDRHLLAQSVPELEAVASLAYSIAEGLNRQLDALGELLCSTPSLDRESAQAVGFLIRSLAQQQDIALNLGSKALAFAEPTARGLDP